MTIKPLASVILLSTATLLFAASNDDAISAPLKAFPKNLARQHVGSNLFHFNAASLSYQPTEAAAAWLDDDVTTGWPVMAGHQHYLLTLEEPSLLTNLAVSTRSTEGKVTLYVGDEPAVPGAKSWTVVAKDLSLESINEKKLAKSFSRFGKYLLIETEIADPGPLYSLYVYGDQPAASYELRKRETPIDTRAIFGPYVNDPTAYSVSALYAHAKVVNANAPEGFSGWQRAIDENPESSVTIAGTTNEAGMVIKLNNSHRLTRFAVLTAVPVSGRLDFFVAAGTAGDPTAGAGAADASPVPVSLEGLTPVATMALDGTSVRRSVDVAQAEGGAILLRWTPEKAGEALPLAELNAFNEFALGEYELTLKPEPVTQLTSVDSDRVRRADPSKDSPDFKDYKDFKGPPVVGEFFPARSPYLPGSLGFPPNLARRGPTPINPPVSP